MAVIQDVSERRTTYLLWRVCHGRYHGLRRLAYLTVICLMVCVPGDPQGGWAERGTKARPGPVHRPQPDGGCEGRVGAPASGGKYRQIMVCVDPIKLEAHGLSVMDVLRNVNEANKINFALARLRKDGVMRARFGIGGSNPLHPRDARHLHLCVFLLAGCRQTRTTASPLTW